MMEEFFHYADGFEAISIEAFRPNADLVITAIKRINERGYLNAWD